MIFKKIIPSSLLGRSIIIIFVPIFLLVIITSLIFYQTSWNIISKRLTESVVADINVIVKLINQNLDTKAIKIAKEDFKMKVELKENANLNDIIFYEQRGILSKRLKQALSEINIPFSYDLTNLNKGAVISLQIIRGAVGAQKDGYLDKYIDEVLKHMWEEPKKMDDPAVIKEALTESGFDAERLMEQMQDPDIKAQLIANTEEAVKRGTFGIPTFFVEDDIYFGKDTLWQVEEALAQ